MNHISLTCSDGVELAATVYTPQQVKAAVMIAPATGIKRRFYQAFATYLSHQGYGVITFDNRSIGDSQNGSINAVNASLINWGKLDMTVVLEALKQQFPDTTYHLIGHSAGGQLVGLMDNARDLKSLFNFAASSGNLANMKYPFKLKAAFFLNVFIPVNNLVFGYTNSQWVGMGERLPKKVASQWSRWCNGSGYVATDFGKAVQEHLYDELSFPSLWLHASDDGIAIHENVKDMVRIYTQSPSEIITLDPNEWGYNDIGHMKFFSSRRKGLWKYAIDWLEEHSA